MSESKVVLITGASSGIGEATAKLFAARGAKLLITGRNEAQLRAVAEKTGAKILAADIADPKTPARLVQEVERVYGRLDTLVNNAGIAPIAPLSESSREHVAHVLAVNVSAVVELTRLALPLLIASKGSVVNVASVVADQPYEGMGVYSASKAALLALTRSWAKELATAGVRVNAVSPGPIATPIFAAEKMGVTPQMLEAMGAGLKERVPMKRLGTSDEVAPVIEFLASSAASFVTGAEYCVGGGVEAG
jgi:NAD(P)-dependent dehydrogenase (short-subunit alcohol dehydrogenase family)